MSLMPRNAVYGLLVAAIVATEFVPSHCTVYTCVMKMYSVVVY